MEISMTGISARLKNLNQTNYGTHRGLVRLALAQSEYIIGSIDGFCRFDPAQAERLVFVCLGNINRSCFADHRARAQGINSTSFGLSTTTGAPAYPAAILTAKERGVDLNGHVATDRKDYVFQQGDWLFAMEIRHARQLVALGYPADRISLLGLWAAPIRLHIHDPHTLSGDYFRTCFSILETAVDNLVDTLRANGSPALVNKKSA
ncbi:putative low molecular weight protein-tyrosine-phosphatase AmsI [Methylococcales bacterium]|nr:putative low molecular weight protein-tyrosine-phosphatase AmsI [Methylococcales bacterium]